MDLHELMEKAKQAAASKPKASLPSFDREKVEALLARLRAQHQTTDKT